MACLQNGTTLLNNNNLSSFKHNIMKYDETHQNMWPNSSQINSFLNKNCQLPFRSNHTKDKTQSDHLTKDPKRLCAKDSTTPDKETSASDHKEYFDERNCDKDESFRSKSRPQDDRTLSLDVDNSAPKLSHDKNESMKTKEFKTNGSTNKLHFFKTVSESPTKVGEKKPLEETGWINNRKNMDASHIYDDSNSYQADYHSDNQMATNSETESCEPSHHARRPMNAFLIFCKRHRTVVKNRYPHLENRAVTKILGEWWAALETEEKACYTELAKQYKNAFFSANPNFKWYKLPAPPLRTLNTRPGNVVKTSPSPLPSPPQQKALPEVEEKPQQLFTPGKLADETQLGSITSLIHSNSQHTSNNISKSATPANKSTVSDNLLTQTEEQTVLSPKSDYSNYLSSPPSVASKLSQPMKPFKKRVLNQPKDKKNIVRSIFSTKESYKKTEKNIFDSSLLEQALENFVDTVNNESYMIDDSDVQDSQGNIIQGDNIKQIVCNNNTNSNLTQQELINKVVDHMCFSKTESNDSNDDDKEEYDCNTCLQNQESKSAETRKSVRSCKGLRYAKFMAEGKLFVNKRNKNMSMTKLPKPSYTSSNACDKVPRNTETIELNETIKKLTERTIGNFTKTANTQSKYTDQIEDGPESEYNNMSQESREEHMKKMFKAADFNLDEKIEALPSLSLDKFQQKKKENKKRKFLRATKMKETTDHHKKPSPDLNKSECDDKSDSTSVTGSRKRKPRKQSITRLDPQSDGSKPNASSSADMDLFGLATLAEVAAKKAKIDQK